MIFPILVVAFCATFSVVKGDCPTGCSLPITIYNDLKCRPIYASKEACCPTEYDCSHIYNHSKEACHFKGKLYKVDERIPSEDIRGTCDRECRCQSDGASKLSFFCPQPLDGCAEFWVGGYPKPFCYLRHNPNECCADGQICPPFDGNAQCEVNGKTYKEGQLFDHPTHKCERCSCKKGFAGKYEEPFCEEIICNAEIKHSDEINQYCAPYYEGSKSCCPNKWICPSKSGKFLPSLLDNISLGNLKCKFGEKYVGADERYEDEINGVKVNCLCIVPPLMTCAPENAH